MVNLKTVYGVYEREALTGLLEENDIPYIAQGNSIGGYLTIVAGTSGSFGTDILVGKNVYERAKELMESVNWDGLRKKQRFLRKNGIQGNLRRNDTKKTVRSSLRAAADGLL